MITRLAVFGYRSIRDLVLAPGRLTVVTGANGAGKSSLYRALRLLADVAQGTSSITASRRLNSAALGRAKFSRAMKAGNPDRAAGLPIAEGVEARLRFSNIWIRDRPGRQRAR
ncbi:MAG: AAA family ATPase [Methylocystis sp.]